MKLSVLLPLHTASTNVMLGANSWAIRASRAKKERHAVGLALSQLPAPPDQRTVARGVTVTLCRVSSGVLDDDNLRGALKHVRDATATWLARDDRDPCITWAYEQQRCERGYAGVRITCEDDRQGAGLDVVLGAGPKRLAAGDSPLPKAARARRHVQLELAKPRAWLLLPWDQDGSGVPVLEELIGDTRGRRSLYIPVPAVVPGYTPSQRAELLRLAPRREVLLAGYSFDHAELGGAAIVYALPGAPELAYFAGTERRPFTTTYHCDSFDPTTPKETTTP